MGEAHFCPASWLLVLRSLTPSPTIRRLAAEGGAIKVETQRAAVSEVTRQLLEDSAQRAALGERARQVVAREYAPEQMAAKYESLYDQVCA